MKTTISILTVLSLFLNTAVTTEASIAPTKKEQYTFRIELCSFTNRVPVKTVELLREIGNITVIKENGRSIYLTAPFEDLQTAKNEIPKYQAIGFAHAHEVIQFKDKILSTEEYYAQVNNDKENNEVIRLYED